eukprot:Polyplicarium_translucidae@DN4702_c0_g1_i2.p1
MKQTRRFQPFRKTRDVDPSGVVSESSHEEPNYLHVALAQRFPPFRVTKGLLQLLESQESFTTVWPNHRTDLPNFPESTAAPEGTLFCCTAPRSASQELP